MAKKTEFVVDSSVVTKWFLTERDSGDAIKVRDAFATGRTNLAVPTPLFYEVVNALRFSGLFKEADLVLTAKSLSKYKFSVWRPQGKLLELSAALSVREGLTLYDACYVALAQRMGSKVITEDKELLDKFPAQTATLASFNEPAEGSA